MTTFTHSPCVWHRSSWASSHTKISLPPDMQAKRLITHSHGCFPHIITALQKRALVTKDKMALPLDHDPTLSQYWSELPRYRAFGANCNAFFSKFTGFSICHPIYHKNTMYLDTRHAIYSAALSTETTATFMFLSSWNKRINNFPYESLNRRFPHTCKFLGSTPSDQLQMQKCLFGTIYRRPFPNTLGR